MIYQKDEDSQPYVLVFWDFNDPPDFPVLFRDADGNTAEGKVLIDFKTWIDGP